MFDFDRFDMNMDGNVDGIDLPGFGYLLRHAHGPSESEHDYQESEIDEHDS